MASYVSTFTGDGSEVHFTAGFPVLRLSDLAVVVNGVWLTLGVDYSVSGSTSGPLATLAAAPANGATVTLRSAVGYTPTDPSAPYAVVPSLNATDERLFQWASDEIAKARGANPYESTSDASTVVSTSGSTARTLASRFDDVVNVKDFGAVGDATVGAYAAISGGHPTEDTAAFLDAIDTGRRVYVPAGVYLLNQPLSFGAGGMFGEGMASIVANNATDMFAITGSVVQYDIRNLRLISGGGGHVFNAGLSSISRTAISRVWATQQGTGKCIWYSGGSGTPEVVWLWVTDSELTANPSATVSPWTMLNGYGAYNANAWARLRIDGCQNVPFFNLADDEGGGTAQSWARDNSFRDIGAELCEGGIIQASGVNNLIIDNVVDWDSTTFRASLFNVASHRVGWKSRNVSIRNSGFVNGTIGAHYVAEIETGIENVRLENLFASTGPGPISADTSGLGLPQKLGGAGYTNTIAGLTSGSQTATGDGYIYPNAGNLVQYTASSPGSMSWRIFGAVPPAGYHMTVIQANTSGGSFTCSWSADFVLAAALGGVTNGKKIVVSFVSDGTHLVESARTAEF